MEAEIQTKIFFLPQNKVHLHFRTISVKVALFVGDALMFLELSYEKHSSNGIRERVLCSCSALHTVRDQIYNYCNA
jgi:hypothetical protein